MYDIKKYIKWDLRVQVSLNLHRSVSILTMCPTSRSIDRFPTLWEETAVTFMHIKFFQRAVREFSPKGGAAGGVCVGDVGEGGGGGGGGSG